jgi:hypothetical protein
MPKDMRGSEDNVKAEGFLPVAAGVDVVAFGMVGAGQAVVGTRLLAFLAGLDGQVKRCKVLDAGIFGVSPWRGTPHRGR